MFYFQKYNFGAIFKFMNPPLSVAELSKSAQQINNSFSKECMFVIKTSTFRSLTSMEDQIIFLKNHLNNITQSNLAKLFNRSPSKISRIFNKQFKELEIEKSGPSSLLTLKEEETIIEWLIKKQEDGDCPSSHKVRYFAQELYEKRTNQLRYFDKSWFYNFKNRHIQTIGVKK